jgi:hypothetical protein|eukprot:COSAG01_NODE_1756_length_9317_cov_14.878607_4_plen_116_part_00
METQPQSQPQLTASCLLCTQENKAEFREAEGIELVRAIYDYDALMMRRARHLLATPPQYRCNNGVGERANHSGQLLSRGGVPNRWLALGDAARTATRIILECGRGAQMLTIMRHI